MARSACAQYETVGLESSLGNAGVRPMVGEPTTFTLDWFTGFGPDVEDATRPCRRSSCQDRAGGRADAARANEIAAAAMEHCRLIIEPGMTEAEIAAGGRGSSTGRGRPRGGQVDLALGFSLVWSGPASRRSRPPRTGRSSRASRRSSRSGSAWTATGATTRRTSSSGSPPRYARARGTAAEVYGRAVEHCQARASRSSTASSVRDRLDGLPRSAVASDLPRCRREGPRAAVRAPGGRRRDRRDGSCN